MSPGSATGRSVRFSVGVVFCAGLMSAGSAAGQMQLTRLVGTGDPAPGLPGVEIAIVWPPQVDNQGNIAAKVRVQGDGVDHRNDYALLYGRPDGFTLLYRTGDPAPGVEPLVFYSPGNAPALALSGYIGYSAVVWEDNDPYTLEGVVYSGSPEDVHLVLRTSDPPPGIADPNVHLSYLFASLHTGRAGHLAFLQWLDGPGVTGENNTGIWAQHSPGGPFYLVAREGDQAPGLDPGVHFVYNMPANPRVNSQGTVAFVKSIAGPGVTQDNNQGVWSGRPGDMALIVRKGDPAPEAGEGVVFDGFTSLALNGANQYCIGGMLRGPGVTADNDTAVWVGPPGEWTLLAREGDAAPGMAPGVVFDTLLPAGLNEAGITPLVADVRGPGVDETNDQGIWLACPGDLELVFSEDQPPPGVGAGIRFSFSSAYEADYVLLNTRGDLVLRGQLAGPGIDDSNDDGFWARHHSSNEWTLAAREGDLLDGRVIEWVGLGQGSGAVALNDVGLFVFLALFTDATDGVYSVRIPHPGAIRVQVYRAL